jgi:hypothetical protein
MGDVGTSPVYVDIETAKVTQLGREKVVFFMELSGPVLPDALVLYSWFINKVGQNDAPLDPGDFAINIWWDGMQWNTSVTKATSAGNSITDATDLGIPADSKVAGATVRVTVDFELLEQLSEDDPTFDAGSFFWWGVTRYGSVAPPNADRAYDVPPAPGTELWTYREIPQA